MDAVTTNHLDLGDDIQAFSLLLLKLAAARMWSPTSVFSIRTAVWVTSRGRCYRGREAMRGYLSEVVPGGLGSGSVDYRVESVHPLAEEVRLVVVEQTYLDDTNEPRDAGASHTHTYTVASTEATLRILAGQNTVRAYAEGQA